MFLYGHPFNFQLMVWTENRKARKWECFQNVVFSLQYIYKSCKKKYQDHLHQHFWSTEKGTTPFSIATPTSFRPKKEVYCSYAVQVKCDPQGRYFLPFTREAGKQECFSVSREGQCRKMEVPLSFSSCFWLNCSSWDDAMSQTPIEDFLWPQGITSHSDGSTSA